MTSPTLPGRAEQAEVLSACSAHLYGVGLPSQTARGALARRALSALSAADLERAGYRFIQQLITEATPMYWLRRAEELERVGTAWADEAAANCRRHAWLLSQEAS